jgi:hypothetical protein
MAPTPTMTSAFAGPCGDLRTALTSWRTIVTRDLAALNALLARDHAAPIPVPSPMPAMPVCGGA